MDIRNRVLNKIITKLESLKRKPVQPVPKNKQQLMNDLSHLPLSTNDTVLIHSGFKALGPIENGPQGVVDALIEELVEKKDITVAMPSFTVGPNTREHLKADIAFDVKNTPTVYRAIPRAFQYTKGVIRSLHPTHSITALGKKADWLTNSHHKSGKPFCEQSPFGKLIEDDGWVMGIGSELGKVTFYHTLEDIEQEFPFDVYSEDSPFEAKCRDIHGNITIVKTSLHSKNVSPVRIDRPNGEWLRNIYTSCLEAQGQLHWYDFARSKVWMCKARDLYNTTKLLTDNGISIYTTEKQMANFIMRNIDSNA